VPQPLRTGLRRYLLHPGEQRSIAPALGLTLLTMASVPFLLERRWGGAVAVGLVGLSAYVALVRTGVHGLFRRGAEVILVISTLVAAVAPNVTSAEDDPLTIVGLAVFTLLLLVTPLIVLTRIMIRPRITLDTVAGALAAYLQIGLFFGVLYRLVSLLETEPFFAQGPASAFTFMYFSFITMTTTGYGDVTPATTTGRTLAVLEAVLGQLFLVTIVALVVSNLGQATPRGRSDAQADAR
jgi:voltage-gated potassium channel Kch